MADHSPLPIYAYTPYGLSNRLLGLASTMEISRALGRPLILVWEENHHIGHTPFQALFENGLQTLDHRPEADLVVLGYEPQTEEDFPEDKTILFICHDIGNFPGIDRRVIRKHLLTLIPQELIRMHVEHAAGAAVKEAIGMHVRQGDKWSYAFADTLHVVNRQYEALVGAILAETSFDVYLCCDDPQTASAFKRQYGNRLIYRAKEVTPLQRSPATLQEALVDFYSLSETSCVLHGIGTFGYGARLLSGRPGCNILTDTRELFLCFGDIQGNPLPDIRKIVESLQRIARVESVPLGGIGNGFI